jgi:hypothetical protein
MTRRRHRTTRTSRKIQLDRAQLRPKELAAAKALMLETQKDCPLCGIDFVKLESKDICLDHDHKTGWIRSLLCRNCNQTEGRLLHFVYRAKRGGTVPGWLRNLLKYYDDHAVKEDPIYHPSYRDADQKRELRNARARKKRAQKQKARN